MQEEHIHGHIVRMFEMQRDACAELGSPLYAAVLDRVTEDLRRGGVCAAAVAGHEDAPGPAAIALRLLGGVHALVLTGRAPELAAHYPSAGGTFRPARLDALWAAFRDTLAAGLDEVRDWMTRPPQTNEVARSHLLLAGALYAADRHPLPLRFLELGSSAGLNLLADHFRISAPGFARGPADSPVQLSGAWAGPVPDWLADAVRRCPEPAVVERRGCDVAPVDPRSADGALALRAYLWPDQTARAARLEGALRLAAKVPTAVERAGAADFLEGVRLRPGTLTVVWHSIMRQYVPAPEWARAERELTRLAEASGPDAAFAHVVFEPRRQAGAYPCRLAVRIGTGPEVQLAEAPPHGLPARGLGPGAREEAGDGAGTDAGTGSGADAGTDTAAP